MASPLNDEKRDPEDHTLPARISHWRMVFDPGHCTPTVQSHSYDGEGTKESPFIVSWLDSDPRNPYNWSVTKRALITCCISVSSLAASLSSSAYTGSSRQVEQHFHVGTEVATLGLSLFVLGFAVGPILFAPLSELYGRQPVFISTNELSQSSMRVLQGPRMFRRCSFFAFSPECLVHHPSPMLGGKYQTCSGLDSLDSP